MFTGKALGEALAAAIELKSARDHKRVTQQAVATEFGVTQPSVAGWLENGRIDKRHIPKLLDYFKDVAGPAHWGLPFTDDEFALVLAYRDMHPATQRKFLDNAKLIAAQTLDESASASQQIMAPRLDYTSHKPRRRLSAPPVPTKSKKKDAA